jgi:hypothetical protein
MSARSPVPVPGTICQDVTASLTWPTGWWTCAVQVKEPVPHSATLPLNVVTVTVVATELLTEKAPAPSDVPSQPPV